MGTDTPTGIAETRPPEVAPEGAARSKGPRFSFRAKVIVVWLALFILLGLGFSLADFDVQWMREHARFIATGIWITLFITVTSIALAVILALLGALGRLSKNSIAYSLSGFYTSFFRGTPLIVQIFLIYYAMPQIAVNTLPTDVRRYFILSPVLAGILALGLNYGAYMTEIFRAGIQAVGYGQSEAAEALGMTYRQRMWRIVLPQAVRIIIPPTGNEFIAMIKDTALVSFTAASISWYEIFKRAQVVGIQDFRPMEAFALVAGMYWGLTIIFSFFQTRLEKRLSRGYVREAVKAAKAAGHGVQAPATEEDIDVVVQEQPHGGAV